jgi:hypothetical protein
MSNVLIHCKCDYCGKDIKKPYYDYARKNKKVDKDCCIGCLVKYNSELNELEWNEKLKRGQGDKVVRNYTEKDFIEHNKQCILHE